jgi:hypothetical protein
MKYVQAKKYAVVKSEKKSEGQSPKIKGFVLQSSVAELELEPKPYYFATIRTGIVNLL